MSSQSSHKVGPWGQIEFPGVNWKGNGALPFSIKNRIGFQLVFWSVALVGLGLPFLSIFWLM